MPASPIENDTDEPFKSLFKALRIANENGWERKNIPTLFQVFSNSSSSRGDIEVAGLLELLIGYAEDSKTQDQSQVRTSRESAPRDCDKELCTESR